ncbi:MAG: topoisomerase DNA-binding C4 zinc finger domain-containing protein [Shewanellaceae bacterium]|nr:topoisomerase DNA-binding C4 zinc finger domain-containing protein [Shewanellaceae bacterium]
MVTSESCSKGVCPLCQSALQVKSGRTGSFVGCSQYPACDYIEPKVFETLALLGTTCPNCGLSLQLKSGRYGAFVACSGFPQCHYQRSSIESDVNRVDCPVCQAGQLVQRAGRSGRVFYGCDQYPRCHYSVHYPPVQKQCERCDFPVLLRRKLRSRPVLMCAKKQCQHQMADMDNATADVEGGQGCT